MALIGVCFFTYVFVMLCLRFVIAAVSPAVVVPSLLSLSERGYGLDKGIPTLVIAAASVDDVLAITGFGVLVGITFSSGQKRLLMMKYDSGGQRYLNVKRTVMALRVLLWFSGYYYIMASVDVSTTCFYIVFNSHFNCLYI